MADKGETVEKKKNYSLILIFKKTWQIFIIIMLTIPLTILMFGLILSWTYLASHSFDLNLLILAIISPIGCFFIIFSIYGFILKLRKLNK